MKDLFWCVYVKNSMTQEVEPWNVFNHWKFKDDCSKLLKKYSYRDEFAAELRGALFRYFCGKFEYEAVITSFPPKEKYEQKIDVYEQVMMNFDCFVEYVWNTSKPKSRNKIARPKKDEPKKDNMEV